MTTSAEPKTLPELVDAGFAKNTTGVACATKRKGEWIETTVDEFRTKIQHFAFGLYDLGVRRGDRVALHSENSTEWLIVDQAVLRLGAVSVPIYTTQPADQVRFILENSEARVYVVSTEVLFAPIKPGLAEIATLEATVGILGTFDEDIRSFDEVIERGRRLLVEMPDLLGAVVAALSPEDLATIIYTSGTTGQPKGVMLTHGNIVFDALASLNSLPFDPEKNRGGRVLSYLPLSHAYERMVSFISLHIGYPIFFIADVNEFREDLLTVRPTFFTTVPRLLEKIYAGIKAKAETLSGVERSLMLWAIDLAERYDVESKMGAQDRLRYAVADRLVFKKIRTLFGGNLTGVLSGGAKLSPTIFNFFNALGIFCGQGYGLTETSPAIATSAPGALRAGSVGKPLRGVEVAIADDGEILTRGPHVMKGYYKLPEETAAVKGADGWFKTGDIGQIDEDGFLYITDRKKELFKLSTGKYIAPAAIEVALGGSTYIEHVVIVGSERKFCSALVVPDIPAVRTRVDGEVKALSDAELIVHNATFAVIQQEVDTVNAALPHWEQIKSFRLLTQPFSIEGGELTPTLKVKRRVVYERYQEDIEEMYK